MLTEHKRELVQDLWRDRIHTDPQAIALSTDRVRRTLQSIWEPAERMRSLIGTFPEGLLSLWVQSGRGHLILTHLPSQYLPGVQAWREHDIDGICYLAVADVVPEPSTACAVLGDLVDHLLGSMAEDSRGWFADGEGATAELGALARRFRGLHGLGYATPTHSTDSPRNYFRRTWALYMSDAGQLNTLDPLVYRLYHRTLMSETWWSSRLSTKGRA